jgi:hypothetical protein
MSNTASAHGCRSDGQGEYRFTSTAVREGKRWRVQCDQHLHIRSQVPLLARAVEHQRAGIAACLDLAPSQVTVTVRPVLPDAARRHLSRAQERRHTASWANHAAAIETRLAARALAELGLSLRDIGTILGVSHQRAHQLLHDPPMPPNEQEHETW